VIALEVMRVAFGSLRAHKLRSFLNLLGIIIAVTTIVAVISVVSGFNDYASTLISQLGPNTMIFTKFGIITSRAEFLQAAKRKDYTDEDVAAIRRLVPAALRITGRVFSRHAVYAEGNRMPDGFLVGAGHELPWMIGLEIEDGRSFTEAESLAARPVAIIGHDVKDELFPHVDPIGRMVKVEGKPFRIVGMMARQGRLFGHSHDEFVLIPLAAYQKIFGKNRSLDIFVQAPDAASRPEIEDAVRQVLRARRNTDFSAEDPFDVIDAEALQIFWKTFTFSAFALVILISSVSLVVGGVAIANTMFASVVERTQEIGIRKAVGARSRDVRRQILFEAATLAAVGGLFGAGLGWLAATGVGLWTPFPARVTPSLILSALVVATLSGLLAGFLPALRASKLDPVEALRAE
jgi:putative ABC transport system permease protein